MRRREALRSLCVLGAGVTVTGCLGSADPDTGSDTGSPSGSTPRSPPTDDSPTVTTTTDHSPSPCESVETEFAVPSVSKPEPLTADGAHEVAWTVERAYAATATPGDLPEVPDDVDSFVFNLGSGTAVEREDGVAVWFDARAHYQYDGVETTETEYHANRPLKDVAAYRVTARRVERRRGYGDLTGTVVCW